MGVGTHIFRKPQWLRDLLPFSPYLPKPIVLGAQRNTRPARGTRADSHPWPRSFASLRMTGGGETHKTWLHTSAGNCPFSRQGSMVECGRRVDVGSEWAKSTGCVLLAAGDKHGFAGWGTVGLLPFGQFPLKDRTTLCEPRLDFREQMREREPRKPRPQRREHRHNHTAPLGPRGGLARTTALADFRFAANGAFAAIVGRLDLGMFDKYKEAIRVTPCRSVSCSLRSCPW